MAASRKRRGPSRCDMLKLLRLQSHRVLLTNDWTDAGELRSLAAAARCVGPKAKRVIWCGIAFPLKRGLVIDSVRDPQTDWPLVGVI